MNQYHNHSTCPGRRVRILLAFLMLTITMPLWALDTTTDYLDSPAPFEVRYGTRVNPFSVLGIFVMPGEHLFFQELSPPSSNTFRFSASSGQVKKLDKTRWRWTAPAHKGLYVLQVIRSDGSSVTFHAFVMVPAKLVKHGRLNGYRIGQYPQFKTIKNSVYRPPRGFVEVTPELEEVRIAPHFKLGQFLCKQKSGYPKYMVLREELIIKLELILRELNRQGMATSTLHVMSGYRTPWYNRAIGNVKYSRHQYGGAADIYVDVHPRDNYMDDLNRDGRINLADADIIYNIVDDLFGRPWYSIFVGGLARYTKNSVHGPFVHVDSRGYRARW